MTDPVSDFINRLSNAQRVGHTQLSISHSKLKEAIAKKLVEKGFLGTVATKQVNGKPVLTVELIYNVDGKPKISAVERVSKPGRRLYAGARDIHSILQGRGVLLVSTPQGVLADDEARKAQVGGELLCKVW